MASIFLSYRREDTSGYAGRLHERFVHRWGHERVFVDLDNIDPGEDFLEVINRTLDQCAIMVVIVGPRWLSVSDTSGRRRIDNPADLHRMEIEAGLKRRIRVIPVLVGDARMPSEAELPESMKVFARRNATEITDTRFDFDAGRLLDAIERALTAGQPFTPEAGPLQPQAVGPDNTGANNTLRAEASSKATGGPQRTRRLLMLSAIGAAILVVVVSGVIRWHQSGQFVEPPGSPSLTPTKPEALPATPSSPTSRGPKVAAPAEPEPVDSVRPSVGAAQGGRYKDLLGKVLAAVARGECPSELMTPLLRGTCQDQQPRMGQRVRSIGKIKTLQFLGVQPSQMGPSEVYRVTHENGSMTWMINTDSDGKILVLWTPG